LAVALALVMVLSMAACTIHEKNEIAVTIDGEDYTTAYYMCALLNAKSEGMGLVSEEDLTEDEKSGKKEIDYFSKKIEDKKFSEWVEDRAIEIIKENAVYKKLIMGAKIKITDEQKADIQNAADITWYGDASGQYPASYEYFEMNGVSKKTFDQFRMDSAYYEIYFTHLYGEGGEKEIPAKEVMKEIKENYILAQILPSAYEEDDTDSQKKAKKKLLKANADYISKGEKTFVQAYKEFNNVSDEHEEHEEGDHEHPKYEYAQVLGAADTGYSSSYYDYEKIKKYKLNEPKVIDIPENLGAALVIRRDIEKDPYYIENYNLDGNARHSIAGEEYEKYIDDMAKKLKVDVKSSIDRYTLEDIKVPETAATTA